MRVDTCCGMEDCVSETSLSRINGGIQNVVVGLSLSVVGLIGLFGFTSLAVGIVKSGGLINTFHMWMGSVGF